MQRKVARVKNCRCVCEGRMGGLCLAAPLNAAKCKPSETCPMILPSLGLGNGQRFFRRPRAAGFVCVAPEGAGDCVAKGTRRLSCDDTRVVSRRVDAREKDRQGCRDGGLAHPCLKIVGIGGAQKRHIKPGQDTVDIVIIEDRIRQTVKVIQRAKCLRHFFVHATR